MSKNKLTILATLILATSLQAKYKDDKIAKDDIPRNEKKLWMRIDEMQEHLESSLLSGDQRFLDQLELARKKVADIMLTAEDEKKSKNAVKELPRAWYFWKRVTAQVEIDDVNEYNLNMALGQRAPEPREVQQQGASFVPASEYQAPRQYTPSPVVNIYNNNGNGGQQNYPAPEAAPQQMVDSRPTELEYRSAPQPSVVVCPPENCNTSYNTFGYTPRRPAKGHLVYEKATKNSPGYYHGTAERPTPVIVVSRGGGGGGHK
jgi:hypothetical protein